MLMAENHAKNVTPDGAADRGPGEETPVLEVLFEAYVEHNGSEHAGEKRCFRNLYALFDSIPNDKLETVTDAVCELCKNCEYADFVGGMKTVIRLAYELNIS